MLVKTSCKVITKWLTIMLMFFISITPIMAEFNHEGVILNVDLMVKYDNGENVEGSKFVIVRIKNKANELLWNHQYDQVSIMNGRLRLEIKGNASNPLGVDVFDHIGVKMEVEIKESSDADESGEMVVHEMIHQPYAIKSRLSEKSHRTKGILGIPIQESEIKDGDILTYRHDLGKWVPTSEDDGITALMDDEDIMNSLNFLDNVSIRNVQDGNVLGYHQTDDVWINMPDQVLRANDVDEILSTKGYLKSFGGSLIDEGIYDEIKGFGVTIRTNEPLNETQLKSQVRISKDVVVGGTVGLPLGPIAVMHASTINIGTQSVQDAQQAIKVSEKNQQLTISHPIKISDQHGVALSGHGDMNQFSVYESPDEVSGNPHVVWHSELNQLGISGFCDDECNDGLDSRGDRPKLNVDGAVRFTGDLIVGVDVLALDDYVNRNQIAKVATSGAYEDLIDPPDLSIYLKDDALNDRLTQGYYNKEQTKLKVDASIEGFVDDELSGEFLSQLSAYNTKTERITKIKDALDNHYDKDAAKKFVDESSFKRSLSAYSTQDKIEQELLNGYVLEANVSDVAKSGDYYDINNAPEFVVATDYNTDKQERLQGYETPAGYAEKADLKDAQVEHEVTERVRQKFVTKQDVLDKGYAKQRSVDILKTVARTGMYQDLNSEGRPDPSDYLLGADIDAIYIDQTELSDISHGYAKITDVSAVGKSGLYADLIDAPPVGIDDVGNSHFTELMKDIDIEKNIVKISEFNAEMQSVVSAEALSDIDLSPFLKRLDMNATFSQHTKTLDLHPVATSGKFSDLSGTDHLVTQNRIEQELDPYVSFKKLDDEVVSINATYFDAAELLDKFKDYNTNQISQANDAELQADYIDKTTVNNEILNALTDLDIGNFKLDIEAEAAKYQIDSSITTTLESYNMGHTIINDIKDKKENEYYSKTQISNLKYVKKDAAGKVRASKFIGKGVAPKGGIIMWSGSPSAVPSNWRLCDGGTYNGYETPDLRGRFIVNFKYSSDYSAVGPGSEWPTRESTRQHYITLTTSNMPNHNHPTTVGNQSQNHKHTYSIFNSDSSNNTAEHNHPYSIGNQSHSHHHRGSTNATNTTHNHSGSANSKSVSHTHTSDVNSKSDGAHGHGTSGSDGSHPHNDVGTSHNSAVTRYFTGMTLWWYEPPVPGDSGVVGNVTDSGSPGSINHVHSVSTGGVGGHSHTSGSASGTNYNHSHSVSIGNGNTTHGHTVTIDPKSTMHGHPVSSVGNQSQSHKHGGIGIDNNNVSHNHRMTIKDDSASHQHVVTPVKIGSGNQFDIRPAYYVLAFIMKVAD